MLQPPDPVSGCRRFVGDCSVGLDIEKSSSSGRTLRPSSSELLDERRRHERSEPKPKPHGVIRGDGRLTSVNCNGLTVVAHIIPMAVYGFWEHPAFLFVLCFFSSLLSSL